MRSSRSAMTYSSPVSALEGSIHLFAGASRSAGMSRDFRGRRCRLRHQPRQQEVSRVSAFRRRHFAGRFGSCNSGSSRTPLTRSSGNGLTSEHAERMGVLEAIADLTVHFMTLCGMLLCLRRVDHVGKFPRSGGFRSVPT